MLVSINARWGDLCMLWCSITTAALACLTVSSSYQASYCITQAPVRAQQCEPNMSGWAMPGHGAFLKTRSCDRLASTGARVNSSLMHTSIATATRSRRIYLLYLADFHCMCDRSTMLYGATQQTCRAPEQRFRAHIASPPLRLRPSLTTCCSAHHSEARLAGLLVDARYQLQSRSYIL